jgi:hypothetical protein
LHQNRDLYNFTSARESNPEMENQNSVSSTFGASAAQNSAVMPSMDVASSPLFSPVDEMQHSEHLSAPSNSNEVADTKEAPTSQDHNLELSSDTGVAIDRKASDYTAIPTRLDEAHDKLDPDSALRSTIINPAEVWTKKFQHGLMQSVSSTILHSAELATARCAAFDLLDALSRSGSTVLSDVALHVVIASTHNFDKTLMDTVVQDNVNPVERVERSCLILASTLHDVPSASLLKDDQVLRIQALSPALFLQ